MRKIYTWSPWYVFPYIEIFTQHFEIKKKKQYIHTYLFSKKRIVELTRLDYTRASKGCGLRIGIYMRTTSYPARWTCSTTFERGCGEGPVRRGATSTPRGHFPLPTSFSFAYLITTPPFLAPPASLFVCR